MISSSLWWWLVIILTITRFKGHRDLILLDESRWCPSPPSPSWPAWVRHILPQQRDQGSASGWPGWRRICVLVSLLHSPQVGWFSQSFDSICTGDLSTPGWGDEPALIGVQGGESRDCSLTRRGRRDQRKLAKTNNVNYIILKSILNFFPSLFLYCLWTPSYTPKKLAY